MPPTYKRKRQTKDRIALVDDPDSGLPKLTEKQEQFIHSLLEGKSGAESYRRAYDCSSMSAEAISVEASRLRSSPTCSLWLRYFQRQGLSRSAVTLENHLAELERGREIAYDLGQASAGIQAEHYRGKVAGLYEDRIRLDVARDDAMLATQLEAILGPAGAYVIAEQLGIESPPLAQEAVQPDTEEGQSGT